MRGRIFGWFARRWPGTRRLIANVTLRATVMADGRIVIEPGAMLIQPGAMLILRADGEMIVMPSPPPAAPAPSPPAAFDIEGLVRREQLH